MKKKQEAKTENWIELPIASLIKAKWNYKEDDDDKMDKLINNIQQNGQIENLIVREYKNKYEIVNGNHRYDALEYLSTKDEKYSNVMCYNLGGISDALAKRIAIETNETKFDTNFAKLSNLVGDILKKYDAGELLDTMPFTEAELSNMANMNKMDWEQFSGEIDVVEDSSSKQHKLIVSKETAKKIVDLIKQDGVVEEGDRIIVLTKFEMRLEKELFNRFCNAVEMIRNNTFNKERVVKMVESIENSSK